MDRYQYYELPAIPLFGKILSSNNSISGYFFSFPQPVPVVSQKKKYREKKKKDLVPFQHLPFTGLPVSRSPKKRKAVNETAWSDIGISWCRVLLEYYPYNQHFGNTSRSGRFEPYSRLTGSSFFY